ncbi:hypothetical protein MRB53_038666 [Persea americana]|nr:hypothetical protein MRB53_038666 [Persea americana]
MLYVSWIRIAGRTRVCGLIDLVFHHLVHDYVFLYNACHYTVRGYHRLMASSRIYRSSGFRDLHALRQTPQFSNLLQACELGENIFVQLGGDNKIRLRQSMLRPSMRLQVSLREKRR